MPYILTTTPSVEHVDGCTCSLDYRNMAGEHADHCPTVSRRAVATLDEAQRHARRILAEHDVWSTADVDSLPESGGTISLPDGTTIEVEPMGWEPEGLTDAEAVAAFNAAQEVRA